MDRRSASSVHMAASLVALMMLLAAPVGAGRQLIAPQRDPSKELAVGKMLVAARSVSDRNFGESVVLLFSYSPDGAAGIILTHETAVTVSRILPDLSLPSGPAPTVFLGGPVAITEVRGLVRATTAPSEAHRLLSDVYLLGTAEALARTIEADASATRIRLYVGYAGWAPGQLEHEIQRGDWHIVAGDSGVVFDPHPDTLWRREIRLADVLAA